MRDTLIDLHRLLFRHNQEIPEWLTQILDEYLYYSRFKYRPPGSSDPALYGLDNEWVERAQWRYRLYQKQEYEEKLKKLLVKRVRWTDMLRDRVGGRRDHSFIDAQLEEINQSIRKTEKRIAFLSLPKSQARQIDIARAKAIPIDSIYEILPNGFFVNNPLRPERSPSNSLYLNRKTNKWQDFGTGAYGDLLDLIMKHHDCDLITAYRKVV